MPAESVVFVDGPWAHRTVTAGGTRFHLAEAGEGPLVLLLHGFPLFWWSWHHQLTALAEAGYRAVAVDLRGYGGSDKPPRGYDLNTLAGDASGLVRALGEPRAAVVGHALGGLVAWTMASQYPKVVRRLAVVSMPHPVRFRGAVLSSVPARRSQAWASRHMLGFQLPVVPERRLVAGEAELVGRILRAWSRPGWPDPATERRFREAFRIQGVAHSALESYRWLFRSQVRPDGHRYLNAMRRRPVQAPTLQLHGALDTCVLPGSAQGSGRYVDGPYRWRLIEGAGHFPHQERPDDFDTALIGWLDDTEPDR
ncbi:alpha/beta fold hydrolase [Allonocardiopsis opalescens]|uniref:Pimeloyl-ACP methyl ester carboxylesterase n=1 Tax=Allonocardiopsis opalescens TaxID=1144618 RepID=A0A2T0Q6Q9_9ACTN|nr:alpha/beta hydrolase [Allonocardiopsis opalescens]PRX99482.1 pimeloyl-ACP methyl ester carboxylesterase [Allonocardiopsis opalescens]